MMSSTLSSEMFSILNMSNQFKDRFAAVLRETKMTQSAFALKIGQTRGNITNWVDGTTNPRRISAEVAKAAELELGYRWEWLVNGTGERKIAAIGQALQEFEEVRAPDENGEDSTETVRFRYNTSASAGPGFENSQDLTGNVTGLSFRSRSLAKKNLRASDAVVINVNGDSMEPTLSDGDQVMYDETRRSIIDGKMYVVRIGKACLVKRLYARPSVALFKSDNPMHEPFEARIDGSDVEVLGQVVWSASWKI